MFSYLTVYHCPSDQSLQKLSGVKIGQNAVPPRYKGNYGPNWGKGTYKDALDHAPFAEDYESRTPNISDGLSKTLAMMEMLQAPSPEGKVDRRGDIWNEGPGNYQISTKLPPNSPLPDRTKCFDQPAEQLPCIYRGSASAYFLTSRSRHPGTVQVLFLDSSVHAISDDIDLDIWQAMSTRNGEETFTMP